MNIDWCGMAGSVNKHFNSWMGEINLLLAFSFDDRDCFKLMTMRGSWVLLLQEDGIEGNKYHLPKTNTETEGCMCIPHMFSLCVQCKSMFYTPKDLQGPFCV